jgi:hypothetical protein
MRRSSLLPLTILVALTGCRSPDKGTDTGGTGDGDPANTDADGDGYNADEDCDDGDANVHPGATETCNEIDDDCDDEVDEDVLRTFYADADDDGYGDELAPTAACARPTGHADSGTDCDDTDEEIHPAAVERCNGIDDNCDGEIDEDVLATWYADTDQDGYGDPEAPLDECDPPDGYVSDNTDCDDDFDDTWPGADEVCDERDNDCDGAVDEDVTTTFWADVDGDGYGDAASQNDACAQPSGFAPEAGDCDDGEADINPGATEICDAIDNDCDGDIDDADASVDLSTGGTWYDDSDTDGYGDAAAATTACTQPTGSVTDATDCDDTDIAVNPAATEVCDTIDNDCDGDIDDADASVDLSTGSTWYADTDGDGFGDSASTSVACDEPTTFVGDATDCDDTDGTVYPGATELCSDDDLDCDGVAPAVCTSCDELLTAGHSTGDGLYTINPTGAADIDAWCEMTTDSGGWTLVQRTVWDWSDSSQLHGTYADWYGTTVGDPDAGNAYRMAGDTWTALNVSLEHMLIHTPRDDDGAGSDCGELYYLGTDGTFTIDSSSTSLSAISASVTFANSTALSTTDSGPSTSCVNYSEGVPWFYTSCCTTCPTYKGPYWTDEAHPMASYIDVTPDEYGNVDADVCGSGAAVTSIGYEGVNVMELCVIT